MLNMYFGSADFDLERFMFGQAAERMPDPAIVMVPDQFTLQAERDALEYMRADTLLNLEIMSRSGFTRKILDSTGHPAGIPVTKYGRFMLLAGIVRKSGPGGVFSEYIRGSRAARTSFSQMLNDEISELKQFGIMPDDLRVMSEAFDGSVLGKKLSQTADIYQAYQEKTAGTYNDNDDLQRAAAEQMGDFARIKDTVLWVYGFEYMAPAMMELIVSAAEYAPAVNVVFTGEDENRPEYDMFHRMTSALRTKCEEHGVELKAHEVPEKYRDIRSPKVTIAAAGDFYTEAEAAAGRIAELVRDEGLRYRDIAVICNDMEVRGPIIARAFRQYGIPLFFDSRRPVMQEPAIEFICALIDCAAGGRQFDDVFRMLRTGFGPVDGSECDRLEMYCRRYHIKSGRWKKDFRYGEEEEGIEGLAEINRMRADVSDFLGSFEDLFRDKLTVREKTEALYYFLTDTAGMYDRIQAAADDLEARNMRESAETARQMWKTVIGIMDQMVQVAGDDETDAEEYSEMFREGLSQLEIGLIPATGDQVLLGSMQRTRTGDIKALFVMGANDGVLPEEGSADGIFSDLEKRAVEERFRAVGRTDAARNMEQDLDIYKNTSRVSGWLFISYASQDIEGSEIRPSSLIQSIRNRYKEQDIEELDIGDLTEPMRLIQTKGGTAPRLAAVLRKAADSGEGPEDAWKAASILLYGSSSFEAMKEGLFFTRKAEKLRRSTVEDLYSKDVGGRKAVTLSASRIEKFSRCPFSFFVAYGLRPKENRPFDVDSRSIGEIFHYCFMRAVKELSAKGMPVDSLQESLWLRAGEADVRGAVERYVDEYTESYREGVFGYSDYSIYIRERLKEAVFVNVWIMVTQVRKGRIRRIHFEKEFRRGSRSAFPPVELTLESGRTVCLEGKIDRIDEIAARGDEEHTYVSIIDYKTGSDKFKLQQVEAGIMLQLMIYLKGAMGGIRDAKPAGVFYFPAREHVVDVTEHPHISDDSLKAEIMKESVLDGIINGGEGIVESMDSSLEAGQNSMVIPVSRNKDSSIGKSAKILAPEKFDELISDVDEILEQAASRLSDGSADADPKVAGGFDACTFCGYRSICGIELTGRKKIEENTETV